MKKKCDPGSISPTFDAKLSWAKITKAQKTDSLTAFFALLGSARVKAAHKTLMKSTPY